MERCDWHIIDVSVVCLHHEDTHWYNFQNVIDALGKLLRFDGSKKQPAIDSVVLS